MLNMEQTDLDFEIPPLQERRWFKVIDTALSSPMDIAEAGKEMAVPGASCHVEKHSIFVLISRFQAQNCVSRYKSAKLQALRVNCISRMGLPGNQYTP